MIIIQSNNNYLFGGYTAVPLISNGSYKNDSIAFLFTLTNPYNIPSTKYEINKHYIECMAFHNNCWYLTFGVSHDRCLVDRSSLNNFSCINLSHSHLDTIGMGNEIFTSTQNFTASDIEVFETTLN